jgi:hypothetical protein
VCWESALLLKLPFSVPTAPATIDAGSSKPSDGLLPKGKPLLAADQDCCRRSNVIVIVESIASAVRL